MSVCGDQPRSLEGRRCRNAAGSNPVRCEHGARSIRRTSTEINGSSGRGSTFLGKLKEAFHFIIRHFDMLLFVHPYCCWYSHLFDPKKYKEEIKHAFT